MVKKVVWSRLPVALLRFADPLDSASFFMQRKLKTASGVSFALVASKTAERAQPDACPVVAALLRVFDPRAVAA